MRKIVAIGCVALMGFSVPAFAQSAGTHSTVVSQPSGGSVVNYQNGLEALGQAGPGEGQDRRDEGGNNGLGIALGVAGVAGGIGLAIALINANKNKSVSP